MKEFKRINIADITFSGTTKDGNNKEAQNERRIICFSWKTNKKYHLGREFLMHTRTMSVTKTVIYVCNKASHIFLKYRWCDTPIFLNAHTANKNKNDKLYSVGDKWVRVTTA